jgi:hypothetical protein
VKKIGKHLVPVEPETTKHAVGGVVPVVLGKSTLDDSALGSVWDSAGNLTRAQWEG